MHVGANHPAGAWLLPELADLDRCDLFHAPANVLPARLRMKTLVTVHDIMWLTAPQLCDASLAGAIKRPYFAAGIRRAIAHADRIATVSQATADAIETRFPGVADRLRVTRSGVASRFRPVASEPDLLSRLAIGADQPFALVVGQSAPYKNHAAALEGFARALGGKPDCLIVFVQRRTAGGPSLAAMARKLGVERQVRFASGLSDGELVALYSSARLLLHPSLCEGFGNPIAEAMACGCPVITSDGGAMKEVAGGAAAPVDPEDVAAIASALGALWNDRDALSRWRSKGLERARTLRWADFAAANVAIYRELVGG
ncbi:glycosyl transferase family 1 [Qipengyuania nanhaisediminis]